MARNVFRPQEVALTEGNVVLEPPYKEPEPEPEPVVEEVYLGPTAADLQHDAEVWQQKWELDKESMILGAKADAEALLERARADAAAEIDKLEAQKNDILKKAQKDAAEIVAAAEKQAEDIRGSSQAAFDAARAAAAAEGKAAGEDAGFAEGKAEVERLIASCNTMLTRIQDKRGDIVAQAEQQIVELCLLITRKVVKAIASAQQETLILNIKEALRKVKTQGEIIVKVNIADLKLATEHEKEFISMVESTGKIEIFEDSRVDQGGCIIETDFGEVDARISAQLSELEGKILEASPIKGNI
jgi:flagellar assembly protein FliH